MDIIKTGEAVDTEKDFCLERFLAFAKAVSDKLVAGGHWADYIDPCSGLSMVRGGCLLSLKMTRQNQSHALIKPTTTQRAHLHPWQARCQP
jgi:hypothetical protein